jgi:parallel beta-helix repeat protein
VACEANRSGTQYGVYLERTVTNFEGNYVTDCDYGMYLYNSLTSIADISLFGDSIFQLTNTTGQSGVYVLSRWRPTFTGVRVRGTAYGIYIATNDTATIRIDSSAVSGTGAAGIYLQPGTGAAVVGLRNNVTNNLVDGVLNSGTGLRSLTLGRFVGNARWAINSSAVFDAHNNYWGPNGPGPGVVGDSSTAIVGDSLPVLTDPTDVPAPAPPALATFIGPVGPIPAPGAAPVRPLPTVAPATVTGRAAIEAARLRAQQRRQEHQQERQRRHEARRPD